ncbi:histidine--tRNA ligase [Amnibacterium flavum]|uniref:Histidine--tRNA ligase n=1 Tax=Amnibacterium flavum TaxID=2173173 RepID=A0A2V1HQ06_9MICO|nr:histidine--tRNA ligase [Amnibacterium flavum]PVZ93692.1 histidine--tRNA ligase [Amnibacterium flavum]
MASQINPPRGMRDFLPADKARRERALAVIKGVYARHGFDEIETPVVEDFDRLHSGLGGDNEKLSFSILKRGIDRDDLAAATDAEDPLLLADLGLRYDLTVPLARFYASHRAELPTVFRALQTGSVWRAERPQKGRYRQFVQCDIDIIGDATALAEVELITATTAALDALGLEGASVRVNDRRILAGLLASWGIPQHLGERALITIDKLDKVGVDGVVAELGGFGIDTDGIADSLNSIVSAGWHLLDGVAPPPAWLDREAYTHLLALRDAVPSAEVVFDPTLVRGMGYYTGTIFEIAHPGSGSSVAGGGRYDGMIGRFLGTDVPAVGFSIGFERILELLPADALAGHGGLVLVYDPDTDPALLVATKTRLAAEHDRVRLERRPRNLKPLLETAAASGWTHFATVAADGSVGDIRTLG